MKKMAFLYLCTVLLYLVACAGPVEQPTGVAQTSALQVAVMTDDFATGRPRVPFVLFDGPEQVADAQAVSVTVFDLAMDPPEAGWSGKATAYSDYEVPYWVVYPELPHAGNWGLRTTITTAAGEQVAAQFAIQVADEGLGPAIGERPPASENRTLETEPDLALLTSDPEPTPALYELTVAEALESGRPSVIAFATPAFCQTQICAPVLDSVEAVFATYGEQANFIHIEVYDDFQELTLAEPVETWRLSSEPWIFVLDEEGEVTARLGGPVSPRELEEELSRVLR